MGRIGTPFQIDFTTTGQFSSSETVYLAVYPAIQSRSQFFNAESHSPSGFPMATSSPVALSSLPRSATGAFALSATFGSGAGDIPLANCTEDCSGNYVLQLRLSNPSTGVVDMETSFVLPIASATPSRPLGFTLVLNYSPQNFSNSTFEHLTQFLILEQQVPISLSISGSALQSAEASSEATGMKGAISQLMTWASQPAHALVVTPYSPVESACLPSSVNISLKSQLQSTAVALKSLTGEQMTKGAVLLTTGVDANVLASTNAFGDELVLLPSALLNSIHSPTTITSPIRIVATNQAILPLDETLGTELSTGSGATAQVGAADLSQIYFDEPFSTNQRVVAALVNVTSSASLTNLPAAILAAEQVPFVAFIPLTNVTTIPSYPKPLAPTNFESSTAPTCGYLRSTQLVQDGRYVSMLQNIAPRASVTKSLAEQLLASERTGIPIERRRTTWLAIAAQAHTQFERVTVYAGSDLTLTSKDASIPVTISSKTGYPVSVVVHLSSPKLVFPRGSSQTVNLTKETSSLYIPVKVKTLGDFPLQVTIETTNGQILQQADVTVRSTAFSSVGLFLTFGSLAVFILWWGRSIQRVRRRRKAMNKESEPVDG